MRSSVFFILTLLFYLCAIFYFNFDMVSYSFNHSYSFNYSYILIGEITDGDAGLSCSGE